MVDTIRQLAASPPPGPVGPAAGAEEGTWTAAVPESAVFPEGRGMRHLGDGQVEVGGQVVSVPELVGLPAGVAVVAPSGVEERTLVVAAESLQGHISSSAMGFFTFMSLQIMARALQQGFLRPGDGMLLDGTADPAALEAIRQILRQRPDRGPRTVILAVPALLEDADQSLLAALLLAAPHVPEGWTAQAIYARDLPSGQRLYLFV